VDGLWLPGDGMERNYSWIGCMSKRKVRSEMASKDLVSGTEQMVGHFSG
jgi:hypothetical protein